NYCVHLVLFIFSLCYVLHRDLHSFPTRRSSDLGQIIIKVLASNRLTMREVNQLHVANIGILQMLADQYGVSALEMRKMVEDGKVNSEIFLQALEDNIGGAALKLGETTRGTFSNM